VSEIKDYLFYLFIFLMFDLNLIWHHLSFAKRDLLLVCRWQDTILEGSRPLPLTTEEATSLLAQLPALAMELQTASSLLLLPLFRNSDFERLVAA
jgi:hypothetical protein